MRFGVIEIIPDDAVRHRTVRSHNGQFFHRLHRNDIGVDVGFENTNLPLYFYPCTDG